MVVAVARRDGFPHDVALKVEGLSDAHVEVVFDPPWSTDRTGRMAASSR